jgi:UDP-N-acetylglucosamine 1-carboxyvinyltransferase
MARLAIWGGNELRGTVGIGGAKNAALPILAASLVASETVTLHNVPNISDVEIMCGLLGEIGVDVTRSGNTIVVVPPAEIDVVVPESASNIRFSIVLLGAVIAKMGEVHLPFPGGDALGLRRIDQHILALERLGAEVTVDTTHVHAQARALRGRIHRMTFPSVSGTENSVLIASAAEGTSVISGVALEPEVQSFMHFLSAMSAQIAGIGSDSVEIQGRANWGGAEVTIMPDRLEAMTYAMFVGGTGGEVLIQGFDPVTLGDEWDVLSAMGLVLEKCSDGVRVYRERSARLRPLDVRTGRYPLFYTDLQPILTALLALAEGRSTVTETLYGSNRFQYVPQLRRMGAQIDTQDNAALISGVRLYEGAEVRATDIRAGAALTLAALSAEGRSVIHDIHHIDRGYENYEHKLRQLGASIVREESE